MNEKERLPEELTEDKTAAVTEYEGMSKGKEAFLKALPLIITLACVGLFALGVKWVVGVFAPTVDTLHEKNGFQIVHCSQKLTKFPNTYYIYDEEFVFAESDYEDTGNDHKDAHFAHVPLTYLMSTSELDLEKTAVKTLHEGNGVYVMQFGEFVLYKLEGQHGVFAPLRDYEESTTSRKNDLYVIRQLLKNDRYKQFELPESINEGQFLEMLEKIEWHLDTQYVEDN